MNFDLSAFLPYQLAVVASRVSKEFAERYRVEFGLTIPEWRVLAHMAQFDAVSVREIQAMLGHTAVSRPLLAGGRGPAERVLRVPWGDHAEPRYPADRPWPGQVPAPAPVVVPTDPLPVEVTDADGKPVTVSARCVVSAPPSAITGLPGNDRRPASVRSWAGPWPAVERWWDAAAGRRLARFQVTTDDDRAWLLLVEAGSWQVEAGYD